MDVQRDAVQQFNISRRRVAACYTVHLFVEWSARVDATESRSLVVKTRHIQGHKVYSSETHRYQTTVPSSGTCNSPSPKPETFFPVRTDMFNNEV